MQLTRSVEASEVEVNKSRRTIRHIFGSEAIDTHLSVIDPNGMRCDQFLRSGGAVPWEHGLDPARGKLPVATSLEAGRDTFRGKKVMVGLSRFHDDDEFSDRLWKLYADKRLRGWSLRFIPDEKGYGPPTKDELRARPDLAQFADAWRNSEGKRGYIVRSSVLGEYSAVAHPSNPDSHTIEVLRSLGAGGAMSTRTTTAEDRWARHEADVEFQQKTTEFCRSIAKKVAYHTQPDYWEPLPGADLRCQVFSRSGNSLGIVANAAIADRIISQARRGER